MSTYTVPDPVSTFRSSRVNHAFGLGEAMTAANRSGRAGTGRPGMLSAAALLLAAAATSVLGQTVDSVITNRLSEPYGIAIEANVYYMTDSANHRVVRFVPDSGSFTTLAGFAGRPGTVDDKGVYARFYSPRGIVSVPARGGLVVADYGNHTLRLVKLDGTVTTIAGVPGEAGTNDTVHLNFPSALAAHSNGSVFIADSKNNSIRRLDLDGTLSTVVTGLSEPNGIAIGEGGDLWIAESRKHTIKRLQNGVLQLIAGNEGQSGAADSIFAHETYFKSPGSLLWLGATNGLLVCDTGNQALRRVYQDPEIREYSVETYAGTLAQPGFVNGPLLQAKFNAPVGLAKDPAGGFLIADLGNNAIRRIQISAPQPPVADPRIGYVIFQKDAFGDPVSQLVPVNQAVFNNDAVIAVITEGGTETYYTQGPTPPSTLEDTIPSPNRLTGNSPPPYRDGLHSDEMPASILPPSPDTTIKVISTADNRRPSSVVTARFQFKTANPAILGDNMASFVVTNITAGAQMWYTTDNSDPVANGPTSTSVAIGTVSLPRSAVPVVFKIRAFRDDYKPSEVITKTFSPDNFQANRISFGFETGEASSDFIASPGQTFYAPVTLSLLQNQKMYSLQFNLTVAAMGSSPVVTPGAVDFTSMLKKPDPENKNLFYTIPASMYVDGRGPIPPELQHGSFSDLVITNSTNNLLAVGWFERAGMTNLYDSTKQDLITYSIAHDTLFESKNQKVVAGGYAFQVPGSASPGDTYQIQIGRPSATSDGVSQDNYIEAPTDGTLTATPTNSLNSIKIVTVGQRRYIVGDAAPFRWFNAGDFGEGSILNNDVLQVFQSAIYFLDYPPFGSDLFDAMDSSDGSTTSVFFGDDTAINDIQFGDGMLNVDDVYVTFRRALDPSLTWYRRYWEDGSRKAEVVPNVFRGAPDLPGETLTYRAADLPAESFIPGEPAARFSTDDMEVAPGKTVQIPVRAKVIGQYPLRVLMLNLTVEPLEGAPALTAPVEFTPASNLGEPTLTTARGANNYAAAWLDSKVTGVAGDTTVGQLKVSIPASAGAAAAYRIHFDHASASPNGLGLFPRQVQDGLLTLKDRTGSTLGDNIPDTWRLRFFGSVSNALAQANADADGDGVPNWAEFKAGTSPVDPQSKLHLVARRQPKLTLRWPSSLDKSYTVEAAPALSSPGWTVLSSGLVGTGQEMQFTPGDDAGAARFFRVRVTEQ